MHIHAIGNDYNANVNFRGLIKDKSALPIIKNMSQQDIAEFKKIEKRLSKTKFWDLKLSSIGNKFKEFKFEFRDKQNKHGVITDGIFPYDKKGNTIKVYSIIYGPENTSMNFVETLKYKTEERATELYEKYLENLETISYRHFDITPVESLKSKEIELNMLEEASQNTEGYKALDQLQTEIQTKKFVGNDLKHKK